VITAFSDTARVWDAATGASIGKPLPHEGRDYNELVRAVSAAFSPDSARVVTASQEIARVWDAATGAPISEPMRHNAEIASVAFSPDGTRVVTTSGNRIVQDGGSTWTNNTARLWDAATGAPIGEPMPHNGPVLSVAFSPDGTRVVTTSMGYTAQLWDAATGAAIGKPMRHDGLVFSAAFSPDSARVVTASEDKTAQVWDAATGAPIGAPMRHNAEIVSAAFSADDARIVTASRDNTAQMWRAPPNAPNIIATACTMLGSNHDTAGLSERYGIEVKDPICASDAPAPDPALMTDR
jgi:WD40 repeat protein